MNTRFEEWGEEQLIDFAKTNYALPSSEGLRRILSAAQAFAAGASQQDGMSLVVLRVS
jgi:serine phosphatase RsbU (regulator of sigma subunit)